MTPWLRFIFASPRSTRTWARRSTERAPLPPTYLYCSTIASLLSIQVKIISSDIFFHRFYNFSFFFGHFLDIRPIVPVFTQDISYSYYALTDTVRRFFLCCGTFPQPPRIAAGHTNDWPPLITPNGCLRSYCFSSGNESFLTRKVCGKQRWPQPGRNWSRNWITLFWPPINQSTNGLHGEVHCLLGFKSTTSVLIIFFWKGYSLEDSERYLLRIFFSIGRSGGYWSLRNFFSISGQEIKSNQSINQSINQSTHRSHYYVLSTHFCLPRLLERKSLRVRWHLPSRLRPAYHRVSLWCSKWQSGRKSWYVIHSVPSSLPLCACIRRLWSILSRRYY